MVRQSLGTTTGNYPTDSENKSSFRKGGETKTAKVLGDKNWYLEKS